MNLLDIANNVFKLEAQAIMDLSNLLTDDFLKSIDIILKSKGRLVISGMGKSGHIGVKISATLASTGTPSFFMHPAEAIHGDLGMLTANDILLAISNSGESEEIIRIIPLVKKMGITLIGMAGNPQSTLAKESDYFLNISIKKEACPLELAPMSSTTATLAMGDALAAALMQARDFKPEDFAMFHPGGSLGKKLLTKVEDIMKNSNLPIINTQASFKEIVHTITSGKLGLCLVIDNGELKGIITDGDLRRAFEIIDINNNIKTKAIDIMTSTPKTISKNTMVVDAQDFMIKHKIKELVVLENSKVVGVIQLYDIGAI